MSSGSVSGEFLTLWARGVQILAGQCLLSREPSVTHLVGEPCPHKGCATLIVGSDAAQQALNQERHDRRRHH